MMNTVLDALSVDPADLGSREWDAVRAAVGTRSFLCTGSWTLRTAGGAFELSVDRGRWKAASEYARRGLRLAGGAALFNLRIAVAALGREPVTALLPEPARPELLASVRMAAPIERPSELSGLYAVLAGGRSRPFPASVPLPRSVGHVLRRGVELEGGWLKRIDPSEPDKELRTVLGLGPGATGTERMVAVIGSFHDLPAGQLSAGQAGQRVALTAARYGLCASILPAALTIPEVRIALARLLGRSLHPQMVLRIAPAPAANVRPHCRAEKHASGRGWSR